MTDLSVPASQEPQAKPANPYDQILGSNQAPNPYDQILGDTGYERSQEAHGLEYAKFLALGGMKGAVDGIAHLGSLAFKAATTAATSGSYNSVSDAWDAAGEALKDQFGTKSPAAMDFIGQMVGAPKKINVYDPSSPGSYGTPMTIGEAADHLLKQRLGRAAVAVDVMGNLAGFAFGPGAVLGETGAKLVQPMAGIVERTIAKSLAKGAGMAPESIDAMLSSGRAMELITKLPQMKSTITMYDEALALAGRNVRDFMGMTAGNMAQTYGLSADDQRLAGAKFALMTAPLAYPFVRWGEKIASSIAAAGIKPEELKIVSDTYQRVLSGAIDPAEAAKVLNSTIGKGRRLGSSLVASMFEGTAFMTLDQSAREQFGKWWKGDAEAGSDLMAAWIGSMAGMAFIKTGSVATQMALGQQGLTLENHHMFRTLRPDLNRLNTQIEGEALRRSAEDAKANRAGLVQEPQNPGGLVTGAKNEIALEQQVRAAQNQKVGNQLLDERLRARDAVGDEGFGGEPQQPGEGTTGKFDRLAETQAQYGWADHPTLGLMRSLHQESKLNPDGSVTFELGQDHSIDVSGKDDVLTVSFDPDKLLPILRAAGRPVDNYDQSGPSRASVKGAYAERLLDTLTLVKMQQTMQGDLDFSRLGMVQVEGRPDLWQSKEGGGVYYSKGIDGVVRLHDKDTGKTQPAHFVVTDGYDEPKYEASPAVMALVQQLPIKQSLAPEPVVDEIIGRSLNMALHSDSVGADQLRQFFASADPQQLVGMLNPQHDQILAFQLGSLGVGNNNAQHAMGEAQRMAAASHGAERPISDELVPAIEGKTPTQATETKGNEGQRPSLPITPDVEAAKEPPPQEIANPTLSDMIEPRDRSGEAGFVAIPSAKEIVEAGERIGRSVVEGVKKLGGALKASPRRLSESLAMGHPDLLRGKGDDAFAENIRMKYALRARNRGEAQPAMRLFDNLSGKAGKAFRDDQNIVDTEGGTMSRGQAIIERRRQGVENVTAAEEAAAEPARQALKTVRRQVAEAGGVRHVVDPRTGDLVPEPMALDVPEVRFPRTHGPDWDAMGDRAFRLRYWDKMLRDNGIDLTPEQFDDKWTGKSEPTEVRGVGRDAAAEYQRSIQSMDAVFEGKHIFDTNVGEMLRKTVHQQAGRAASLKIDGPDLTDSEREHMREVHGVDYGERKGVQARLREALQRFGDIPGNATPDQKLVGDAARKVTTDVEGGMPEGWQMNDATMRALYTADQIPRATQTLFVGTQDIGDLLLNSAMFGRPGMVLKGFVNTLMHPIESVKGAREALIYAERIGTIVRGEGMRDQADPASWWRTIVDTIGKPSHLAEALKTAIHTREADAMLSDWAKGRVEEQDRWVVADMLKFSPEQQRQLFSGKASEDLQSSFRHEFVKFVVSRRSIGEGSRFSASPATRAFLRRTNWMSGNLLKVARVYKSVGKDIFSGDAKLAARGVLRGLKATGLITASGAIGKLLSYAVAGLIRGENGAKRWWDELAYAATSPGHLLSYIGKTFGAQVLGGPLALMVNSLAGNNTGKNLAQMTVPGAIVTALVDAFSKHGVSSPLAIAKTIGEIPINMGYVPLGNEVRHAVLASSAMLGADSQVREDERRTSAFLHQEGIESPSFAKNKPDAFYEAMGRVRKAIETHPDDPKAALDEAAADLQKALGLTSKQSVAATIRTYQHGDRVPKDSLEHYSVYMGDDAMKRVYAHDQVIREFAKHVGLMHGEQEHPIDQELSVAEHQSRLGGGSKLWPQITDRLVEDAAVRLDAGQEEGDDLRRAAESMAAFPDQLSFLPERQFKAINRDSLDYSERARLLENILRRRARERSRAGQKRARRAAREGG